MSDNRWFRPWVLEPMPLGMNCKPWYLDKLPSKCLAKYKNKMLEFPTSLNSRRWILVKEGLDDFRKGCPPCEGLITRGAHKSFLPMISHKGPPPAPKTSWRKPCKDSRLLSTYTQNRIARKMYVDSIEASLTPHPLASFLNLEEDLPADLLLKVLKVLDPERKIDDDTWAYCEGDRKRTREPMKLCKYPPKKALLGPPKCRTTNPDGLPLEETSLDELPEPPPIEEIPKGISDFCEWVATFGDLGVDEQFIINRFDFDTEYKPIFEHLHMKKITQVCSDLKITVGLSEKEERKFITEERDIQRKLQKPPNPYKPNWVKMRYGAWYLKPKLWKKLMNDEPLIDPKVLLEAEARLSKPDILDDLYGTIAFKDFIRSKGYRMPEFLARIFKRKGWTYDSVKTPMEHIMK
uniref:Family with sequence similarity 47 member E n=1 Tax=Otolemur garnettii TaxID=30611 RepID=H0XZF6_OTOGA